MGGEHHDQHEGHQPHDLRLRRISHHRGHALHCKHRPAHQHRHYIVGVGGRQVGDPQGPGRSTQFNRRSEHGEDLYVGAFVSIGENCLIGNNVKIYPNSHIGDNVKIGDNTTIYSGVNIYSDCIIGKDCSLHAGVIIGADGFGFSPASGQFEKVAQIGNVIIEDHVEIGAGTTIDRATLGSTIIRKGAKLDNLIQIAHNVDIGENTVIAAQTGIAGSTTIGKNCMIGGQVGIIGHIFIADKTMIAAQSGVGSSINTPGQIIQGSPGFKVSDYRRAYVVFRKLPELERKINELENALALANKH